MHVASDKTILIVDDEPDIASVIEVYLQEVGYSTHTLDSGASVIAWVKAHSPELILLDLMLPEKDGVSLCKEIRQFSTVPIIMVTAKVKEIDRLIGLEAGADDYICKPFSVRELVARVNAILRRVSRKPADEKQDLTLDEHRLKVCWQNDNIDLTAIEYNLFSLMVNSPGRIYSRQQIIDSVYSDYRVLSDRTVDSHIRNLRKKLRKLCPQTDLIHSIYGLGYKYEPN